MNENDEVQGLWAVIFFTYITYALLPIRLQEAIVAGCVLAIAHFLCIICFGKPQHINRVSRFFSGRIIVKRFLSIKVENALTAHL